MIKLHLNHPVEELAKSVFYNRKIISISVIFGKTEHVVKLIELKNLSTSGVARGGHRGQLPPLFFETDPK